MTRRRSIICTICLVGVLACNTIRADPAAAAGEAKTAGFGIVVSADGHILTPFSEIDGCTAVASPTLGPLHILDVHADLDLALLQAQGGATAFAPLGDARAVEPGAPIIIAASAPGDAQTPQLSLIPGRLLAASSSLDNALYLSILTPELSEKSAALVLDRHGGIVAVIVRKLESSVTMYNDWEIWPPLPSDKGGSINAIGEVMLRHFLDHQHVTYATAPVENKLSGQTAIERLREAMTMIECWR